MPQANGSDPVLLSTFPIVVPVSLNGREVMSVGELQVSPPSRGDIGDSPVEVATGVDFRRKGNCTGSGDASTTNESPRRATSLPTVFIRANSVPPPSGPFRPRPVRSVLLGFPILLPL